MEDTLDSLKWETLKHSDGLGNVVGPARERKIVQATHALDLNVKTKEGTGTSSISGSSVLPGKKLVLIDYRTYAVKTVNLHNRQVLSRLQVPRFPWDVSTISSNMVAVTMPYRKELAIIVVGDSVMHIDRTIAVNGECWGVDCRNGKVAVSFLNPHKVQVLSLQGSVLHTLSSDQLGSTLFNKPYYLTYGQDDTTLYVSNLGNDSVVCVKLDGTVVATYIDSELLNPRQPIVTSNGDVLVCGQLTNTVHQITKDCIKVRVLLSQTDGLSNPQSICLSEEKGEIYVGMHDQNIVKVFKVGRE